MPHPLLNSQPPFYQLHPCHTANWMGTMLKNVSKESNYLVTWLSFVAPYVGLKLSEKYAIKWNFKKFHQIKVCHKKIKEEEELFYINFLSLSSSGNNKYNEMIFRNKSNKKVQLHKNIIADFFFFHFYSNTSMNIIIIHLMITLRKMNILIIQWHLPSSSEILRN